MSLLDKIFIKQHVLPDPEQPEITNENG